MSTNEQEEVLVASRRRLSERLRDETTGGVLLIISAIFAIAWANSPWSDSYQNLISVKCGIHNFQLPLSIWAADFLLAIFFLVVGIELKHEFVAGSLSSVKKAVVPFLAAFGGMAMSAIIFLLFNHGLVTASAWGIPISTDIAFALAILAIAGRQLPAPLRIFLLTLAVVHDLGAIVVIAIFYGHGFHLRAFVIALVLIAVFAALQKFGVQSVAAYIPLALASWYFMYESGIHATVAGVLLGLSMRVAKNDGELQSPAHRTEHVLRPISAGLCVPLFALMSAGVDLDGVKFHDVITSSLTLGIVFGLVIGQPVGVLAGTFIGTRFTGKRLPSGLKWADVIVVGTLASIGFTVALLVSAVSFGSDPQLLVISKCALVLTNLVAVASSVTAMKIRARNLA